MAAPGKTIAEKLDDEKWEELFQKTIEAIELFGERPDLLRGFVNALQTGEFRTPQRPSDLGPPARHPGRGHGPQPGGCAPAPGVRLASRRIPA